MSTPSAPAVTPTPPAEVRTRRVRPLPLAIGIGLALAVALVPSPLHRLEGYGDRPAYAAAVALLMAAWWFTDALPIGWTACVPLLLFPALDVFGQGTLASIGRSAVPYVDPYIFLFMGGMTIGAAMELWGLHRRIALHIMRAIGTTPRRLLLGMLAATAAVSMWISNTATAVMMLPIAMALLAQLEHGEGGRRLWNFGAALMLSVAYGANVGGIGTKIGTGTNSIFLGFAADKLGADISFLGYVAGALPFVLLFLPLAWWALWQVARKDTLANVQGREVLDRELSAMGPLRGRERRVAGVFVAAAALWIAADPLRGWLSPLVRELGFKLAGKHVEAGVAMSAALALALLGTLSFAALRKVPWDTLLLLGGSFAMAEGIEGSGLSAWLAHELQAIGALPMLGQLFVAIGATIGLSAVASNTATINVMLNVLPRSLPLLFGSAMAASCDFALPAGTPPNAIVFGSGYVSLRRMMKLGALLDLAAVVVLAFYSYLYVAWLFPG